MMIFDESTVKVNSYLLGYVVWASETPQNYKQQNILLVKTAKFDILKRLN